MRDFSFDAYKLLINSLKKAGYSFQTMTDYTLKPANKVVLIRHDIDVIAESALRFARIEKSLGVNATYYFRVIPLVYKPQVILDTAKLDHEIGYHYEDLSRNNGNIPAALSDFEKNLKKFRSLYPIKTICMHGSSGSPYDNRTMWSSAKLSDYELIAEPYLSLDFNKVLYLSDTSQRWNGSKIAVRDKVKTSFDFSFTTTWDILNNIDKLPPQIMLTIHPELWTNTLLGWLGIKSVFFVHSYYKTHFRNKRTLRKQSQNVRKTP